MSTARKRMVLIHFSSRSASRFSTVSSVCIFLLLFSIIGSKATCRAISKALVDRPNDYPIINQRHCHIRCHSLPDIVPNVVLLQCVPAFLVDHSIEFCLTNTMCIGSSSRFSHTTVSHPSA